MFKETNPVQLLLRRNSRLFSIVEVSKIIVGTYNSVLLRIFMCFAVSSGFKDKVLVEILILGV